MKEQILEDLKLSKGIEDELQDDLLNLIIRQSYKSILARINQSRSEKLDTVPLDLDWVVLEVSIKRFNRLDSEGTTKHDREGESFTWDSYLDEYDVYFAEYADDDKEDLSKTGVMRIR